MAALAFWQATAHAQTGNDYLKAYAKTDCTIPFDVNAEGKAFNVKWGMDAAWDWNYNVNRGIAHIGIGNMETGRISFQPNDLVIDNGDGTYSLTRAQQTALQNRINLIKSTGTTETNINCDHEALNNRGGEANYRGKPQEWYKLIKASVQYANEHGLKVVSVSPFNEPDYGWKQFNGSESNGMKDFLEIAKLIKADPFFDGIRVCGGNTLNCDRALPWYNYLKEYIDEGNTHQLAGVFDTYANFFAQVKKDGKVASADEMHNVGEAMVALNYGLDNGIWWGFDSKARGQYCIDTKHGVQLGYGEDRKHWTAGSVLRNNETGEVHGFLGSSERQANNSSYRFVSTTKDVYFNGYGPTRQWTYTLPGGTGYQVGQINAELLFDVTWGEDVAPGVIDGTYIIMNAASKTVATLKGTPQAITCSPRSAGNTAQHWKVYPSYTAGDCSYWFIDNAEKPAEHWNLRDRNLNSGASVITYNAGHEDVEQWYLKYARDGYYYIISRLSNKYLYSNNGSTVTCNNAPTEETSATEHSKYLWRFQPIDSKTETTAPASPAKVTAEPASCSITLKWDAVSDDSAIRYTILRGENGEWNTIGRNIARTQFLDNNAIAGHSYTYKVVAVDYAGNRSKPSEEVACKTLDEKGLIMQLQFDESLNDVSANAFNASASAFPAYSTLTNKFKSGTHGLKLDGNYYVMIPNAAVTHDEMTIAAWVNMAATTAWQRIFDFGSDTDHYMFLTPKNGNGKLSFVMKNGGDEEIVETSVTFGTSNTKHVAVTIKTIEEGKSQVVVYVNGEVVGESNDITIKPSDIAPALSYIGRSQYSNDPMMSGYIDDFRVYNYPLTAEEILAMQEDTESVSKDLEEEAAKTLPVAWEWVNDTPDAGNFFIYNSAFCTFLAAPGTTVSNPVSATMFTFSASTGSTISYAEGSNIKYVYEKSGNASWGATNPNLWTIEPLEEGGCFIYHQDPGTTMKRNRYIGMSTGSVTYPYNNFKDEQRTLTLISEKQMDSYVASFDEYVKTYEAVTAYSSAEGMPNELIEEIKATSESCSKVSYLDVEDKLPILYTLEAKCRSALNPSESESMTHRIVNPNIIQDAEATDLPMGWSSNKHVTSNGHYTAGTSDSQLEATHTSDALDVEYHQVVTRIPNGLYSVSALCWQEKEGNAALFAETWKEVNAPMTVVEGDSIATDFILVTNGQIKIGVKASGSANRMIADNFELTYHGVPQSLDYHNEGISMGVAEANKLMEEHCNKTELQAVLASAEAEITSTTQGDMIINALYKAIENAHASVAIHAEVKEHMDKMDKQVEGLDKYGKAKYAELVADIVSSYEACTITNAEYCIRVMNESYVEAVKAQRVAGTDLSELLNFTNAGWTAAQGDGPNSYANTSTETYSNDGFKAGKIIYQRIKNLIPGFYEVQFYAIANFANHAWVGNLAYGEGIAQAYANDSVADLNVVRQTSCTPKSNATLQKITAYVGENGTLEFGIKNIKAGGNWSVVEAKSLIYAGSGEEEGDEGDNGDGKEDDDPEGTGTSIHTILQGKNIDIYSADGIKLSAPIKGMNILKSDDGTTRKVWIK